MFQNYSVPGGLLSALGLLIDIAGALLISIEGFGIREFVNSMHDTSNNEHQTVQLFYVAFTNNISVFALVNTVWSLALIFILGVHFSLAALLWFVGYPLWRLLSFITNTVYNRAMRQYRRIWKTKGMGCIQMSIIVLPYLLHSIFILVLLLIWAIVEFGLDIPFRYLGEKVFGRALYVLFEKANALMERQSRSHLKEPILIGAGLLILGFSYQFIGTLLSIAW